jgi:hypothetical protein
VEVGGRWIFESDKMIRDVDRYRQRAIGIASASNCKVRWASLLPRHCFTDAYRSLFAPVGCCKIAPALSKPQCLQLSRVWKDCKPGFPLSLATMSR